MTYKTCTNYNSGKCNSEVSGCFVAGKGNMCLGSEGHTERLDLVRCVQYVKPESKYSKTMKEMGMRSK